MSGHQRNTEKEKEHYERDTRMSMSGMRRVTSASKPTMPSLRLDAFTESFSEGAEAEAPCLDRPFWPGMFL
jgi:hypothetical protein